MCCDSLWCAVLSWVVVCCVKCCRMCFSVPCQAARSRSEWPYVARQNILASSTPSGGVPHAFRQLLFSKASGNGFDNFWAFTNIFNRSRFLDIIARRMKFYSRILSIKNISQVKLTWKYTHHHQPCRKLSLCTTWTATCECTLVRRYPYPFKWNVE